MSFIHYFPFFLMQSQREFSQFCAMRKSLHQYTSMRKKSKQLYSTITSQILCLKDNAALNTLFIADMGSHPCCLWARSSTAMTAADLCPPGQLLMIASIRFLRIKKKTNPISAKLNTKLACFWFWSFCLRTFLFSGVNSKGVSGLFSGLSLCFRRRKKRQRCQEIIQDRFTIANYFIRLLQRSYFNKTHLIHSR